MRSNGCDKDSRGPGTAAALREELSRSHQVKYGSHCRAAAPQKAARRTDRGTSDERPPRPARWPLLAELAAEIDSTPAGGHASVRQRRMRVVKRELGKQSWSTDLPWRQRLPRCLYGKPAECAVDSCQLVGAVLDAAELCPVWSREQCAM
jgi:hypothetical protein